jgi:O-antigen/teichoic acid export membrane protein
MNGSGASRARRLVSGWSANFFQMILGITQQVALVPVFLHFWSSEVLAAWLAIYSAGNLVLMVDAGLHVRAINRFFAFKSCVDGNGRTSQFYAAMLRIYLGLTGLVVALLMFVVLVFPPSVILGFGGIRHFDLAFLVMTVGVVSTVPANLVTALYRAHGLYGRAVKLQSWGMLIAQLAQLVAIASTGSLLAVAVAFGVTQSTLSAYFLFIDAPAAFPFLRRARARPSWSWIAGQFRKAIAFGVSGASELALVNLPVLLVSAFVSDRVAVAQWGLTRIVAGLLRVLSTQATLPLAAELGHDYAVGLTMQLRSLYARGSVFVTLLASLVVAGLLPFWPDFLALWTHGAIPYDPLLTITLLIGTTAAAPAILAFGYANYSNRGQLLVRTKGLQLVVFLVLSIVLIPSMGPLGAALAIVSSDLLVQFGLLAVTIIRQTLHHPWRHIAFLALMVTGVILSGWGLGLAIRQAVPGAGLFRFVVECSLWLLAVAALAAPLASRGIRSRLTAAIPL